MTARVTQREELPDLEFRRYRKVPKPVTAMQLKVPEDVPNRPASEGFYHGEPGVWKVIYGQRPDGSLDTAIIQPDIFAQTYEHLGGDQYRKKAVVVEAAQLDTPLDIVTLEGPAHGEPGDWLILGVEGEPYFADDDYVKEHYILEE